jgi:hypothetical protein
MSNKTATLKYTLTYTQPGGGAGSIPSTTILCPYAASDVGEVDVADATVTATEFPIPFGSIDVGATLLIIFNNTTQELIVKVNAGAIEQNLAVGKSAVFSPGGVLGGAPITDASVTTTDAVAGDGTVGYFVFGDPV